MIKFRTVQHSKSGSGGTHFDIDNIPIATTLRFKSYSHYGHASNLKIDINYFKIFRRYWQSASGWKRAKRLKVIQQVLD